MTRLAIALAIVLLAMPLAGGVMATTPDERALAGMGADTPERRVALGVGRWDGHDLGMLDALGQSLGGRLPAIWVIWSQWGSERTAEFPMAVSRELADRGVTPMIWWSPVDPHDRASPTYARYRNTIRGDHDEYIRRFARAARAFGEPVLLRYAHEANGSYFPWSIERHDNTAAKFKRAWRHVHRIFSEEDATNVRFVWSVATQRCPGGCDPYAKVYPGDAYVDVLGFSTHNWGAHKGGWRSMYEGAEKVAGQLARLGEKPLMMAEVTSNSEGGDKAAWIRDGFAEVYERLPAVTAIVYLDSDQRPAGHPDWRLQSPPEAMAAFADVAALPTFATVLPVEATAGDPALP